MTNFNKILLEKLNLFIDKNLENEDFSIDNICIELGLSRSQLHRILTEETQLSTTLYIRKQRLLKAKYLLSTTNLRISEVSDAVGINNHANFSKYFIEEFNVSPSDFKKQIQEQEKVKKDLIETTKILDTNPISETQTETIAIKKTNFSNVFIFRFLTLLVLLGAAFYFITYTEKYQKSTDTIDSTENSIAILPFKNLGDTTNSYFSEGVMEQIHSSLASLNNLKVISTTSSKKYVNTQKSILQIAQDLRVNYILSGSVLQLDKQVRITVELINAKDDRVVWTKNFEGDTKNIFTYINTVSKEVAGELDQKLSIIFNNKLDKTPTKNLAAYNEFLKGQQLVQTRTKEKIEASIAKFEAAIILDPTFADAYANCALANYLLGEDLQFESRTSFKLAEKNALTAIKLDVENGRAYGVLANIYRSQNKWEQSLTTYQIALKFSPNDAQINYWYSLTLRSIGHMDNAIKFSTKAVSLDPLASNIYGGHLIGCAYAGKYLLAENAIKEGELIFNDAVLFHNAKAFYYIIRKDYEKAFSELEICMKINGKTVYFETLIAYTQGKLGQISAVNLYLKTLPKTPENDKNFAIVYAGLSETENCLKYLELAAEKSESPNYIKTSPLFIFLHKNPRFDAVLQKLGLLNPNFSTQIF